MYWLGAIRHYPRRLPIDVTRPQWVNQNEDYIITCNINMNEQCVITWMHLLRNGIDNFAAIMKSFCDSCLTSSHAYSKCVLSDWAIYIVDESLGNRISTTVCCNNRITPIKYKTFWLLWMQDSHKIVIYLQCLHFWVVNSLWPSEAIWHRRSWSTLVQVMACCLRPPIHYLNQCWLTINIFFGHNIFGHPFQGNVYWNTQDINLQIVFEIYTFKITVTSPWGLWVKMESMHLTHLML